MRGFETRFLEEAKEFIAQLDSKIAKKIIYNLDVAEQTHDSNLFKKVQYDIWEFRTKFAGLHIRLLAFWDKSDNKETLVIATHGFVKKFSKIPTKEINKAVRLRNQYFESKLKK